MLYFLRFVQVCNSFNRTCLSLQDGSIAAHEAAAVILQCCKSIKETSLYIESYVTTSERGCELSYQSVETCSYPDDLHYLFLTIYFLLICSRSFVLICLFNRFLGPWKGYDQNRRHFTKVHFTSVKCPQWCAYVTSGSSICSWFAASIAVVFNDTA